MLIRERTPKLQQRERSTPLSHYEDGKWTEKNSRNDLRFSSRNKSTALFTITSWCSCKWWWSTTTNDEYHCGTITKTIISSQWGSRFRTRRSANIIITFTSRYITLKISQGKNVFVAFLDTLSNAVSIIATISKETGMSTVNQYERKEPRRRSPNREEFLTSEIRK